MALARRRCYSIERLLRGLRQILPPFLPPAASQAPFPPPPPPRHSLILHLLSASLQRHTHARGREGKGREEKRESVPLFLPVTPPAFRLRPFPPKPSRDPTTSSPLRGPRVETSSSFSLTAARGGGGSGPLCLSLLLLLPLLRASPLSRRGEESAVIRGRPLSILSH